MWNRQSVEQNMSSTYGDCRMCVLPMETAECVFYLRRLGVKRLCLVPKAVPFIIFVSHPHNMQKPTLLPCKKTRAGKKTKSLN